MAAHPSDIQKDSILEGPFWAEPVRVIASKGVGAKLAIEAVGIKTNTFYQQVLSQEDLQKVRTAYEVRKDFTGDSELFFLAIESWRIRYAYQFDPLWAVNVSQIDPLPHQIDAVYYYMLKNPKLRFLLADDPGAYPKPPLSGRITWRVTDPWVGVLDEKEKEAQAKARELMERLRKRGSDREDEL